MSSNKRLWNCSYSFIKILPKLTGWFFCSTLLLIFILLWNNNYAQPLASNKNKFVGNVISNGNNIRPNFSNYWNQVTAENAGKWGSVEGTPGNYNWTQLDNIYNYALTKGFPYKHHCLVWGNQQPGFLASLDSAAQYQEVENWIKETGTRYPNADMCDVVNEPLHAVPVYKNALGGDGATGWDWVIKAFELARKYWSPNTKLLINEYSVINDGNANSNYLKIINLLKDRGLVDGIGIQGHNFEVNGGASLTTLKTNLDKLTATGLPVYISEFDINVADDNTQLQKYQSIFPLLYEEPGVEGITLWGYIYNEIWQADAYLIDNRNAERPAMQWLRNYLLLPFKPLLVSPVSATEVSLTPALVWMHSDSATSYHVQVSIDRNFSSIIVDSTVTDTLLQLSTLNENSIYYWRVNSSNEKGTSEYTAYAYFMTKQVTGINLSETLPKEFRLDQNYPNPFNPTTTISFVLHKQSEVRLVLMDLLGREVMKITEGNYSAGEHKVQVDASNLASGIYIYRLTAGNFTASKKMILIK